MTNCRSWALILWFFALLTLGLASFSPAMAQAEEAPAAEASAEAAPAAEEAAEGGDEAEKPADAPAPTSVPNSSMTRSKQPSGSFMRSVMSGCSVSSCLKMMRASCAMRSPLVSTTRATGPSKAQRPANSKTTSGPSPVSR